MGRLTVTFAAMLVAVSACGSQSDFANAAAGSLATATSNINEAFSDESVDHRHHLISGDFNGDGYLDNAYASNTGERWYLVVHLDVLAEQGEIVILDQHTPDVPIDEIRLETWLPGEYKTSCGYMPEECGPDEPRTISTTTDSINLVVLEASSSLIYWDSRSNSYERHWLTD